MVKSIAALFYDLIAQSAGPAEIRKALAQTHRMVKHRLDSGELLSHADYQKLQGSVRQLGAYVDGEYAQITTTLDALTRLVANEHTFERPGPVTPGAVTPTAATPGAATPGAATV